MTAGDSRRAAAGPRTDSATGDPPDRTPRDESADPTRSRRRFLALAGAAAATAGCTALAPSSPPDRLDAPTAESEALPERPDTIFMSDVERTGYWPDRSVPAAVEVAWSIPGINMGDHTAAKSSPLVDDDAVIVSGDTGTVHSYTLGGERNWSAPLNRSERGTHSTPAIVSSYVFTAGYDGAVYAFDAETGDRRWRTDVSDAIGSSPVYYDGMVYAATEFYTPSGGMVALDAATGAVLWEDNRMTNHAHSITGIDTEGRAFAAGCNDGSLYVWDLDSREFRGMFETGGAIKGPVCMYDGRAVFGSWDGNVYAVDTETVEEVWSFDTGDDVMSGGAVHRPSETLAIGNHGGTLYGLDVATGDEQFSFETGGMIVGSVTAAGDVALVGSYDTTLYAVNLPSGDQRWSFEPPRGWVTSAPAVHDGSVYVTERAAFDEGTMTRSGHLYKLVAQ